ncbi:MAG: alpha/beta hydrolase, partial [Chlamydiales bacterium]|nr:alpha/beta hydrolase [Chlamydiales bacterium]
MSFINEKTIDTRFNYLKHLSLKSLEFKGSLKHIKGPDDQGQLVLSGCQKIIRHIKDFFLYIPMNIVASIIEGSLFPKIDYHKSNHLNFSYFINSGEWMPMPKPPAHSEPCCGSPSSPMGRQIRGTYYPYRYIDSNYLIKSEEGTTALKYSGLGPDYAINKVPHDIKEKKLVIFFQGNGETLAQFDALKKTFMQTTNTAVCMVDWAKHGASEGTLDHESMLRQAELVYQFAIQHLNYKEEDITIKGMSLGCYQALSLAERHPNISELELDQPFTTMEQISRTDAYCNSGFFILR